MPEQETFRVPDGESNPAIDTRNTGDGVSLLAERVKSLEKAVHRLRLALYCGLAVVLFAGVLAAEWLFKQSVRRVDDASGSMQTQIDQRAKASRLNIEDDLSEIRRQLKAIGGERSPESADTTKTKAPPSFDD